MADVHTSNQIPNEGPVGLFAYIHNIQSHWVTSPIYPDPTITLNEISHHDHSGDCWIVIYDRVYDITSFLKQHPGGSDVLLEYAGRDATIAFRGTGHSQAAIKELNKYLIGQLPSCECIYRKPGGIFISDLPD